MADSHRQSLLEEASVLAVRLGMPGAAFELEEGGRRHCGPVDWIPAGRQRLSQRHLSEEGRLDQQVDRGEGGCRRHHGPRATVCAWQAFLCWGDPATCEAVPESFVQMGFGIGAEHVCPFSKGSGYPPLLCPQGGQQGSHKRSQGISPGVGGLLQDRCQGGAGQDSDRRMGNVHEQRHTPGTLVLGEAWKERDTLGIPHG